MNWKAFSYIGLMFAVIYRVPQIVKIYRTKSAADLSSYSYLTHNGACEEQPSSSRSSCANPPIHPSLLRTRYLVHPLPRRRRWVICAYFFSRQF